MIRNQLSTEIISFSLQYPNFLFPGKTQFEKGNKPNNIKILELINSINPISWIKTALYINKKKPEVVVFNYWMPFFAISYGIIIRLINKKSIKTIALCHNIIPHEKRFFDNLLNRFFLRKCKGFITLSKSVLDDLSLFTNSQNKQFTPHPIYDIFGHKVPKDEAIKKLKLDANNKYLLFFGLVRKYKGLDLLLKALASESLKSVKNLKLIVAGEFYDHIEDYMTLIDNLGISEKVIIKNEFIPSELVKYYFCASDLITQTYHTATQSGVTQIAYHFERPMLVTNVGGLAEIVMNEKVGFVTKIDPEKIAKAIAIFYNKNLENTFSKNVTEEKHRFSWDNFIKVLDTVKMNCN